jgi:hypothetical protein
MPRSLGTGIYTTLAGTDAVTGSTVESEKYNLNVHDVENDLNTPRPIVAGGTDASNAKEAAVKLKVEQTYQDIVNYDSDRFSPGSFRSKATGVSGAPIAGHAFAGICYTTDDPPSPASNAPPNTNITIEARDFDDTTVPAKKYVRQKLAGVWGLWSVETVGAPGSFTDINAVRKAGDTMTGLLILSANPSASLGAATKGYVDGLVGTGGGGVGPQGPSGPSGPPGPIGPTGPGGSGTSGLPLTGGTLTGNLTIDTANNSALILDVSAPNAFRSIIGTRDGLKRWQIDLGDGQTDSANNGSNFAIYRFNDAGSMIANALSINRLTGKVVFAGETLTGGAGIATTGEGYKPGGGPWLATSDARIKIELGYYTNSLDKIKLLEPVRFRYKGNDIPDNETATASPGQPDPKSLHYQAAISGQEFSGLIAQEAEEVMPEMVTRISAKIDGVLVDDMRILDTAPLIYCLINAIKELAQRVETLEAAS